MKKILFVIAVISGTLLFVQCNTDSKTESFPVEQPAEPRKDRTLKKYDGIREAQQMEFEMTKEVKTGVVPAERLVKAVERDLIARRSGIVSRLNATNWIERGPNTNVIGPSNGNARGPFGSPVTSGRTRAIWVDLADASNKTVWMGAVSGGLWKTTDITSSPANWILIDDFLGNLAVTSICQNPATPNIMYFGTGEKTFNTDAVRGGGIWKSTDHGVTWNLLTNTTGFFNVSKVLCDAAGNIYVATIGSNGIQRSTDGGATWTSILPTGLINRVTEMRLSGNGRLHIVCGYRNAGTSGYRYTDNPATVTSGGWDEPITTFPTAYNSELAVAGNTLYALPSNASDLTPTIYKSTDGGSNWATTSTSPPGTASEPTINAGQGWFDLAIGVDPNDPNIVIAGGLNFYRSDNGGGTWTQITRWVGTALNYVHADHHTVVWNGAQVLVGTDGGIFYSSDNGNSFIDRNVGVRTKQFYSCAIHPSLTNYFLGGTQDNGTHQMNNPGLTGSVEVLGGDGGFVHIDENEPQFQFGSTTRSNYRRSINGGASWSSVNFSNTVGLFINPTDYDDINNLMYTSAGTSNPGSYVRWNDPQSGSSFSTVSIAAGTSSAITSIKVSNYTNNRVYFGSTQARIVRVDNAQTDFPTVVNISGSNMPVTGNTVSSINNGTSDNHLIATFSNYGVAHVFASSTGGGAAGWTDITGNLPDIPVRWAMFYPEDNDKAIIATELGIFETDDINGASTLWVRNTSFPVVKTNMLQYRYRDRTLLAATHGRGMWTTTFSSATPYIRFASSYIYSGGVEGTTGSGSVCRSYRDYTIPMSIDQAPAGTATATLSISGGTAVQGVDFDFTTNGNFTSPSNVATFNSGSTAEQAITVRVYNDAEIEGVESLTFSYAVSGVTNALAAPSSQIYTFHITDNDRAPTQSLYSGNFTVGNFETNLSVQTPFRSNLPKYRIQYLYTASELASAGIVGEGYISAMTLNVITKNSTQPFNGLTISMGNTSTTTLSGGFTGGLLTQVYAANYTTIIGANTFNFSTPFYWDGISNLLVNICFDNGSSTSSDADIIEGVTAPLGTNTRASTYSSATTGTACSFNAAFISDVRAVTTFAAASGNPIAIAANTTRNEFIGSNGIYHFYSGFDIISRLSAASGNFGCVTSRIAEAGNVWQTFFAGPRSQKVVAIDFAGTAQNSSYTLGLYYTAAELSGKDPNLIRVAGTSAATVAGTNSGNTSVYTTSVTNFGTGYLFTANVFGPGLFFLAEASVTSIRNPSQQENFVKLLQNPISTTIPLSISNQSRVNIEATLFSNNGQLLKRWNLGRPNGNMQLPLNGESLPAGVYILRIDAGSKTQSFKVVKQ